MFIAGLPAPGSAYSGWTFVGVYTIDDAQGIVSYSETGSFAPYPACSSSWEAEAPSIVPTTDLRHLEEIRFDTILMRWMHISQQDLVRTITESACAGTVQLVTPSSTCGYTAQWMPNRPITDALPLPPGWSEVADSRVANQTAIPGLTNAVKRTLDLSYHHIQPKMAQGAVPFTGRVSFVDETDGGPAHTGSMIAGRCVGSYAGGSQWSAGPHDFKFSASKGIVDQAPMVPGYGPLGSWTQWLEACNVEC